MNDLKEMQTDIKNMLRRVTSMALDLLGVEHYVINEDLSVDVDGDVDLSGWCRDGLITFGTIRGSYNLSDNNLTLLTKPPRRVMGDLILTGNNFSRNYLHQYDFSFVEGKVITDYGILTKELKMKHDLKDILQRYAEQKKIFTSIDIEDLKINVIKEKGYLPGIMHIRRYVDYMTEPDNQRYCLRRLSKEEKERMGYTNKYTVYALLNIKINESGIPYEEYISYESDNTHPMDNRFRGGYNEM